MGFFDKKEEVLQIELTQYGKHLLSKGEFIPVYYSFFDDDVTYDWQYAGDSAEKQNYAQERILDETPSPKIQYVFSGRETIISDINESVRNNETKLRDKNISRHPKSIMLYPHRWVIQAIVATLRPHGQQQLCEGNLQAW